MAASVSTAFPFVGKCTRLSDENLPAGQSLYGSAIATTAAGLERLRASQTGASLRLQALPERTYLERERARSRGGLEYGRGFVTVGGDGAVVTCGSG